MSEPSLVAGLEFTRSELDSMRGDHFLGWNENGVTYSTVHISADEIILREEMPGHLVDEIMASVAAFQTQARKRRPGGELIGQVPTPLYFAWKRQWDKGPRQNGILWRTFLSQKLHDTDYSRFLIKKSKLYVNGSKGL